MIVVHVSTTDITIDGHAEYRERGKDIVCAAVSMLAWNLIESLEKLTKDAIKYEMTVGHICISFKNLSERGNVLVDSFLIGIKGIVKFYGERYVQIS